MSHTVTAGLDGSRESHAGLAWAAAEAVRRGATLEIVQVHETGAYPYSQLLDDQVEIDHAERVVKEVAAEIGRRHPGLHLVSQVVAGRPSHVLDELGARSDLLVLGTRGFGGLRSFFVGSTALPTVAHARCPVVLVRAGGGDPDRKGDVVLGLKPDKAPEEVLRFAFDTAERRSVALRVLYGMDVPPAHRFLRRHDTPPKDAELVDQHTEALRARTEPWRERHPDVPVTHRAVVGPPAVHLVEEASDAALLVVGRRPNPGRVGTYIGSVTHAVMHHAVVPVAVVPHD